MPDYDQFAIEDRRFCFRVLRPYYCLAKLRSFDPKNRSRRRKLTDWYACSENDHMTRLLTIDQINRELESLRILVGRERNRIRKAMAGSHTPDEIHGILALQRGCCIYCNAKFGKRIRPTRDHILAVGYGGSNWGLNIVMACRPCNSRRCDIPFRTYCRLLSSTQNRKIVLNLKRRLRALDKDFSSEAFLSFSYGLDLHEPRHPRYLMIQRDFVKARGNAARNPLLPRLGNLIRSL